MICLQGPADLHSASSLDFSRHSSRNSSCADLASIQSALTNASNPFLSTTSLNVGTNPTFPPPGPGQLESSCPRQIATPDPSIAEATVITNNSSPKPILANLKSHEVEDIRQFTCALLDACYSSAFFLQFVYSQGHICLCLRLPGSNGKLLGTISGRLEPIVNRPNVFSAHIYTLAIDGACRRLGFGSQLVSDFIEKMQVLAKRQKGQLIQVTLESKCNDVPAQSFYQKLGFLPTASIQGYYGSAGDGLILVKKID